jgi:2-C-methyl-D-erythritol 4-phosphate cytidylyltransferase
VRVVGVVLEGPPARALTLHGVPLGELARATAREVCDVVLGDESAAVPLRDLAADLVLVHDSLCPLLPAGALAECLEVARRGVAVVGVRPVTDTVKRVADGRLAETLDRDQVLALASPLVLPASALPVCGTVGELGDLASLVAGVAGEVEPVEVPAVGRRVADAADLEVLAAYAAPPA